MKKFAASLAYYSIQTTLILMGLMLLFIAFKLVCMMFLEALKMSF